MAGRSGSFSERALEVITPQFKKLGETTRRVPTDQAPATERGSTNRAAWALIGKADNYIDVGRFDVVREEQPSNSETT